jgi:hypothetical protein
MTGAVHSPPVRQGRVWRWVRVRGVVRCEPQPVLAVFGPASAATARVSTMALRAPAPGHIASTARLAQTHFRRRTDASASPPKAVPAPPDNGTPRQRRAPRRLTTADPTDAAHPRRKHAGVPAPPTTARRDNATPRPDSPPPTPRTKHIPRRKHAGVPATARAASTPCPALAQLPTPTLPPRARRSRRRCRAWAHRVPPRPWSPPAKAAMPPDGSSGGRAIQQCHGPLRGIRPAQ